MNQPDFDLSYWLQGDAFPGIPKRPDTYTPGHIKWGSNPARGRGIMRSRANKARLSNLAFFAASILPTLAADLARKASLDYGRETGDYAQAKARGWQRWCKGDAASWIHETDSELIGKAQALGASIEA